MFLCSLWFLVSSCVKAGARRRVMMLFQTIKHSISKCNSISSDLIMIIIQIMIIFVEIIITVAVTQYKYY